MHLWASHAFLLQPLIRIMASPGRCKSRIRETETFISELQKWPELTREEGDKSVL